MFAKRLPLGFVVMASLACACASQNNEPGGSGSGGNVGPTGLGGAGGTSTASGGAGGTGTASGGAGGMGTAGVSGTGGAAGRGGTGGGTGGAGAGGAIGTGGSGGATTVGGSENSGTGCTIPAMPSYAALATNAKLPDPFLSMSGTRIATKADWTCRRAEIAAQLQNWELGTKPAKPSQVSGSVTTTAVNVTAGDGTKSISFTASISLPAGNGPFPAIIGYIGGSLNSTAVKNLGVAIINFNNDDIAVQNSASSRGQGKFYTLYGSTHNAGSMMAWAWGVSRIIDVLEQNAATSKIDAKHIGVTGCSRDGKGALVAGAFDERIALTIPQESGSGGTATWRISDSQKAAGMNVQTLSEITGENDWFTNSFSQFNNTATKLPYDHHMLLGMVAPRAVLAIDNTGIDWLTAPSSWGAEQAGRMIFQALGVPDNLGASQVSHGDHCTFQASQEPEVDAYIKKFLLGQNVTASVNKTDGPAFNPAMWVAWTTPTLP